MISLIVTEEQKALLTSYEETGLKIRIEKPGDFSLQTYVQEKMENLNLFSHLFIEEAVIEEDSEETEEIIMNLKEIYKDLSIVIYSKESEFETEEKDGYIRINDEFIQDKEKMNHLLNVIKNPEESAVLNIGILAGEPRAGATTLAINLANYIKGFHPDVCYLERKNRGKEESSDLSDIATHCNFSRVKEGRYLYQNLCYLIEDTEDFGTKVKDYGSFQETAFLELLKDDIRIIVSGAKPYELCFLDSFLAYVAEHDEEGDFYVLFKSVPEAERITIRERYLEERFKIGFIEYTPDFFEVRNKTLFFRILHKYFDIPSEPEEPLPEPQSVEPKEKKVWKFPLINKAGIAAIALLGTGTLALAGITAGNLIKATQPKKQTAELEIGFVTEFMQDSFKDAGGRAPPEPDFGMVGQALNYPVEQLAEAKKEERVRLLKEQLSSLSKHSINTNSTAMTQWILELSEEDSSGTDSNIPEGTVAQTVPAETKPVVSQPAEPKPAESNTEVTAPEEPKPEEPKPAEPKPAEPNPDASAGTSNPGKVDVSIGISLSGYHGQVYAGDNTAYLFRKFSGQKVALKLTTSKGSSWYNYAVSGNSLVQATSVSNAPVDVSCSYFVQKIQINGEDVGLEFIQQ